MKLKLTLLLFAIGVQGLLAQSNQLKVGVLIDRNNNRYSQDRSELINEVQSVLKSQGEIVLHKTLVNNFDIALATSNFNELSDDPEVDVILAFGMVNNIALYPIEEFKKPTILLGAINYDLIPEEFKSGSSGIHNLNIVFSPLSLRQDIEVFYGLAKFERLGILIEDYRLSNEEIFKVREIIDQLAEDYGFEYGFIAMSNLAYTEMTFDGFDAVYLAGGANWSVEDMDRLIDDIKDSKLPSFSAYGVEDVKKGILASNQSADNKKLLFRRIALNLEQIVEFNEDAGDLPISAEYYSGLTINVDQFNALGIGINYDLISDIDFVGEFKAPENYLQLGLTDVLNMVLDNNLQIKSDSLAVAISGQEVKNSIANYFPKIDVSSQGKYTDPDLAANAMGLIQEGSLQASLQLSQNLYSQDLTTLIKINKLQKKAQNERYNATILNAINGIYNAYYFSLALNANLKIQAKNLDVTRENLKIATENYKAGSKGKMDLLRFTSEKAQNTQALIESNNSLKQSYNQIKQILNLPQEEKLDVKDVTIEEINQLNPYYERILEVINTPNLTAKFNAFLIEEGMRNAPELKAIGFDIESAEKQARLKGRGRFVPNFALVGQYNNNLQTWGEGSEVPNLVPTTYNVAVNVSIPIFDQNKKNIDRTRALIQKDQLETNQTDLKNIIAQNISDALLEIVNQAVNIKLSRISEETASESLSLTQTSYTEGAVTITQLIDAQRNHLSAQLDLANAEYSFFSACNNLEREISYYFVLHDSDENESFFQRFYTYALEN